METGAKTPKSNLQVIGVGVPRTGTKSLQAALILLGFTPCHHMESDILQSSFPFRRGRQWVSVFRIKDKRQRQAAIRTIFDADDYTATVDFPPSEFADDLVEMYPQAKFILSLRKSPEAWKSSFMNVINVLQEPWFVSATYLMPSFRMSVNPLMSEWEKLIKRKFGCQLFRTTTTDYYLSHNEWIRKIVPKHRLLEHEASQGWEPLCQFLNVPVPTDTAYPRLNKSENARGFLNKIAVIGIVVWAIWAAVFAILLKFLQARWFHLQTRL